MFKIRFQGFITHAYVDGRWVVVFYNEPGHELRLAVYDHDWLPDETNVSPVGTGDGLSCFDIYGHMHLESLEFGQVQPNLGGVPHLKAISDGDEPRNEIRRRLPHADFTGYLDLNGGLLSVADWFESTVTFNGFTLQCLPRTVLYSANALVSKNVVLRFGEEQYITLTPHAEVTVRNMDTLNPTPGEYQFYKSFFRNVTTLQQPAEVVAALCPYGTGEETPVRCGEGGTLGVECSNNQFP